MVSRFNLLQSFNYTPYLFYKKVSKKRSILSVYGQGIQYNFLQSSKIAFWFCVNTTYSPFVQKASDSWSICCLPKSCSTYRCDLSRPDTASVPDPEDLRLLDLVYTAVQVIKIPKCKGCCPKCPWCPRSRRPGTPGVVCNTVSKCG